MGFFVLFHLDDSVHSQEEFLSDEEVTGPVELRGRLVKETKQKFAAARNKSAIAPSERSQNLTVASKKDEEATYV